MARRVRRPVSWPGKRSTRRSKQRASTRRSTWSSRTAPPTTKALSDLDDDGLFARTAPPDGLQGTALADRMEQELGGLKGKTINIGARNDLYGTGFADSLEVELEERGATVAEKVIYDPEQPSYNSEAEQITSGNP